VTPAVILQIRMERGHIIVKQSKGISMRYVAFR